MRQLLKKSIIGLIMGSFLIALLSDNQVLPVGSILICYLWSLGSVFAFEHHVHTIERMLNPGLKLSVISFLSFGNGFMGSIPILVYVTYCLLLGWVYGILLMLIDLYRVL